MDQKKETIRNVLEQNTTCMFFYEDSFTKTPWAKPQGARKEIEPKEIEVLSRRLWQLVNGLEETVEARTQELRAKHLALQERTESLEEEIKTRKELELELLMRDWVYFFSFFLSKVV